MIPEVDLSRIRGWVEDRNRSLPQGAREEVRHELEVTGRAVTIVECRPPWRPEYGPEWTRLPIARLDRVAGTGSWKLSWPDRNLRFRPYRELEPTDDVGRLLEEIERDPTGVFWG